MAQTKIEWTEKVWNPITGCSPVSEGCKNCYARRMAQRLRGRFGYPADDPFRVTFHPNRLEQPLHWKKPSRIFVCSMGDLFHEDITEEQIDGIFYVMTSTFQSSCKHTYLILTKRPQRIPKDKWYPWKNIWLGVSVENQRTADERIPILLQIPAAVRFVSVEPMLEQINITHYMPCPVGLIPKNQMPSWIICGGESGSKRRPFELDWARDLRDQCKAAGVPFFMKQVDKKIPIPDDLMIREYPD